MPSFALKLKGNLAACWERTKKLVEPVMLEIEADTNRIEPVVARHVLVYYARGKGLF